jgi:hypothetical protein
MMPDAMTGPFDGDIGRPNLAISTAHVNFANPGRYLAVCTFLPHFLDKMFGYIKVLP